MRSSHLIIIALLSLIFAYTGYNWDTSQKTTDLSKESNIQGELEQEALLERINALETDLTRELIARQQLEKRLDQLEEQIQGSEPKTTVTAQNQTNKTDQEVAPDERLNIEENTQQASLSERLTDAGIAPETVVMIQQRVDENRLQRLQLRDQAIREGWLDSAEFVEKMQQIGGPASKLKQEFGEQVYDQYLYASGRPNRVVVREVMNGSAAEGAGIQAGDIIISYANKSIYSMSELRQATTEGNAGETILVELTRNNSPISVNLPRGPMGISMDFSRLQP